ncbi:partial D-glycero-alpha-D-manno-heptose-7-phosphate kinase, partial [Candidatus Brocadiaceae bacterium]
MIITRTPFRISFIGGGSDLKDFYSKKKGAVLSTTINKYMYISSHPFFNRKVFQLKYSKTELANSLNDIQHPILREVLRKFRIKGGLEISSNADIPAGTGLGSSSAFTVGLLHNLYTSQAKYISKNKLADDACAIEIDILKEPIGRQDQYASAFGGLNIIEFLQEDNVQVEPIAINSADKRKLQNNLLMFYTKIQRSASEVLKKQKSFMADRDKFGLVEEMIPYVYKLRDALYQRQFDYLGEILHKGWCLKKKITKEISNENIDYYYKKALEAGALGGKLLGAGGGGFLLFYCPLKKQNKVRKELK